MDTLARRRADIQARLDQSAAKHGIPGMALGLLAGDESLELATGVVNLDTGVETTPDTVFQIGSITKMYTATLVMKLVGRGEVDLDAPVLRYLPELRLKGNPDLSRMTVKHLLTHTSGIEGDCYFDTGRSDDAVEKLVARLEEVGLIHPPGESWSYCNTGLVLAGRIIEKVSGMPWHQALQELLVKPLGVRTPVTLAEDVVGFRAAIGHIPNAAGDGLETAPLRDMPMSQAPAGSRPFGRVGDLLRFAKLHIDGGVTADGTWLLPADLVQSMQEHHFDQPLSLTLGQGIGWFRMLTEPELVIAHAGDTKGFASLLVVAPKSGFAAAALTNASHGEGANFGLVAWAFQEFAGIKIVPPGQAAAGATSLPADIAPFAGTYAREGVTIDVGVDVGELVATMRYSGVRAGQPDQMVRLRPVAATLFVPSAGAGFPFEFSGFDAAGRPEYVHGAMRVHRRVAAG
jgi:CubicO group peptidase (beta-lactamase class C family)